MTRAWHWGIAVIGDPAGSTPDIDPAVLATAGDSTVILLVHHPHDVARDAVDLASATVRVRVLGETEPHVRTIICDVVIDTPSMKVNVGDADEEISVPVPSARTKLVASAVEMRREGLDTVWIDLISG